MNNCSLPNCYPASYDINESFDDVPQLISNLQMNEVNLPKEIETYRLAATLSSDNASKCGLSSNEKSMLFKENIDYSQTAQEIESLTNSFKFRPLQRGDAKESANALLHKCPNGYKDVKMGAACQSENDFFFKDGYMDENFENELNTPTTKRNLHHFVKDEGRYVFDEGRYIFNKGKHKISNTYLYIGSGIIILIIILIILVIKKNY